MSAFEIRPVHALDDVVVVGLRGDVDLASAGTTRDALLEHISNRVLAVVLDLSEVTYLDSAGLQLVFDLAERLRRRAQKLTVVAPTESIAREVIAVAGLEHLVPVEEELAASLAGLKAA